MATRKPSKKKKLARQAAKVLIKKGAAIVQIPTEGMVTPALSFDQENVVKAGEFLLAAGYSPQQTHLIVHDIIHDMVCRAEASMDRAASVGPAGPGE